MTTFHAVLFDMDGTLLDTERLMIDAGMLALTQLGLPPRREVLVSLVGVANADGIGLLHAAFGPDFDVAAFDAAHHAAVRTAYDGGIPLRPGAEALLTHLRGTAMPIALATNARTPAARQAMAAAGIDHHFGPHLYGRDLVTRPKPAPDVFLHAAAALGADPARCLVFEDSDAGTIAARAAGMTVVQVPDMRPPGTDHAHLIADSLLYGARHFGIL